MGRRWSARERAAVMAEMRTMYVQGFSIEQIAAEFDCSYGAVRTLLAQARVTMQLPGAGSHRRNRGERRC
jgi:DNA-directed RNA polymerase specialized sigma24 family protein